MYCNLPYTWHEVTGGKLAFVTCNQTLKANETESVGFD